MGMNISKDTLEIVLEALDDNAFICDADGDEMNNDQVLRAAGLLRGEMEDQPEEPFAYAVEQDGFARMVTFLKEHAEACIGENKNCTVIPLVRMK